MIDMHCHILPHVDDGSDSIERSINMIKNAVKNGFTDIILTPHYSKQRGYRNSLNVLLEGKQKLEAEMAKQDINITLHLGTEVDFYKNMDVCVNADNCLSLNNSKYVLLDFTFSQKDIDDAIYEVQLKGFTVIVAHPERYKSETLIEDIKKWKKTGALIQLDATSLTNRKSVRKVAKELIKQRLIDFVASDAHKNETAYDSFMETIEYIEKKTDKAYVELLTVTNPKRILENK